MSGAAVPPRSVTVTAVGHPAIRVSHAKTLELTTEGGITSRATCVAGVSAAFDPDALALLRGPVSLRLEVGERRADGTGIVNPDHAVAERVVLRRSRHLDADTLVVDATLVAGALGRELAAALSEPGRPITLTVTEQERPAPVVILAPAAPPGRLGALWPLAAVTVMLDDAAGRPGRHRAGAGGVARWADAALADAAAAGGVVRAVTPTPPALLGPDAIERLVALAAAGARLACPADPLAAALLAAGLPPAPALHLGRVAARQLRRPDLARLVALAPGPVALVAAADEAEAVAAWLPETAPGRAAWIDDGRLDVGLAMVPAPGPAATGARLDGGSAGAGDRFLVLGPAPDGGRAVDLDRVVSALVAGGLPGRQIADALRPLGVRRSDLYRVVGRQGADLGTSDEEAADDDR